MEREKARRTTARSEEWKTDFSSFKVRYFVTSNVLLAVAVAPIFFLVDPIDDVLMVRCNLIRVFTPCR